MSPTPLDSERWKAIGEAFDHVLSLEPLVVRQYLDELATRDASLAEEVERLIAADERTSGLLDGLATEAVALEAEQDGRRIGAYRLVRRLGAGGMGVVWLAERADGAYQGQVALKLIRTGFEADEAVRRFVSERQILAALQHPNIARLLDGGTSEDGTPYLVMELVEGEPIDEYVLREEPTVRERIALFLDVCAAVQYAHSRFVVHRDLKPNNILVSPDGTPKLLDFGIAKLLDAPELGLAEAATRTGARLLTPRFASPEQIQGEAITAATDVYSLGVLLYRLLTGDWPYGSPESTPSEVERAILEEAPARPSVVGPERLRRELAGDLDTILLVALQKDVDRRYGSVEAFARDLDRHLRGLPVEAQPDTWRYRTGKFLRRNQTGVGLAAGFVALLAGAAVTFGLQAARIASERDIAEAERAKAEQVSEFLVEVFEASDPNEAQGVELTAGEILTRGGERIQNELGDQPEVRTAVMDAIGRVYQALAEYDSAEVFFAGARDLRAQALGEEHPDYFKSLTYLGSLARRRGNADEAIALHTRALEGRRALYGSSHADVALSLSHLGVAMNRAGNSRAAESLHIEALAIRRDVLDPTDNGIATSLNNLASSYDDRGQRDTAIAMYREVLDIRRAALGEDHIDYSMALNNLATAQENAGRYDEAEPLYREALAIRERLLEEDHHSVLSVQNNLAVLLIRRGRAAEAEPLLREIIAAQRRDPDQQFKLAGSLNNFAMTLIRLSKYDEAAVTFAESLEMLEADVGLQHPILAFPLSGLGRVYANLGRFAEAEDSYRRALDLRETAFERPHPLIATALDELGSFYLRRDLLSDAEPLLVQALDMRRELLDPDHPEIASSLASLGRLHLKGGEPAAAEPLVRNALAIREAKLDSTSVEVANARGLLGWALSDLDRLDEAESLLVASLTSLDAALGPSDEATRAAADRLAELHERIGR